MQAREVKEYWSETTDAVLQSLQTSERGIAEAEAGRRIERYGKNALPRDSRIGWFRILFEQFRSPLLLVLLAAGVVTLFLREWGDSAIILGAVIVNAFLGLYQELKAENTLALLETLVKDTSRVMRDGVLREIDSSGLVPGDIVHLQSGRSIPADGRVITENDLHTDESALTGESLPIHKTPEVLGIDATLADRKNMVFAGTQVVQGIGVMVVTTTGVATEFGKIASLIKQATREETPLQKALSKFALRAGVILGALAVVLFGIGLQNGIPLYEMFLISVATAVSAVPEGLPIALTVILAVGVERLARRKGIVRKLLAAETLGSTTLILTDKTGTLTEAKLELVEIVPHKASKEKRKEAEKRMLEYAVAHTDVVIENPGSSIHEWKVSGSPVEATLVREGARLGAHRVNLHEQFDVSERLPFNSTAKFAASILEGRGERTLVVFGAPEVLLTMSNMPEHERSIVLKEVEERAESGERVLAIAIKDVPKEGTVAKHAAKRDSEFLGLIAFRDKIRPTASKAIEHIAHAGVKTVIVTGDHAGTAKTVARELGFELGDESVLVGKEIEALDDEALKKRLVHVKVIARTTPEQKLRIARLYKSLGEVVAMTGDGVNDAPALREANIGVAVGSGTDVAKSSADLVLLDNNFETIVAAIEEGRIVLQNIRKVIVYMLSNSFDELFLIGGSLLLGLALPLNALQILWVNLFADSFPAVALAFESHKADIGKRPSNTDGKLFNKEMQFLILVVGTITSIALLMMYVVLLRLGHDPATVRTFIFAAFGLYTLFLVFSVRSLHASIFSYGLFSNHYLVAGSLVGVAMMTAAIYLPPLQALFSTVPLSWEWIVGVMVFGICAIAIREASKYLFRHGYLQK